MNSELGAAAPTDKELKMAEQLVNDMADAWSPDLFHDEFKEKLNALVQAVGKSEFICRSSLGESCPYTLGCLRRADT